MSTTGAWSSYERRLVPRLAAPFAVEIARELAGALPGRLVVDVAAGTGATGVAVAMAQPGALTLSVDLDETALAVGRDVGRATGLSVAGDAMRLPVRTGVAAAVVCQQGLQFVPDLDLVCTEARRVLLPGGRLVALTWADLEDVCVLASLSELADSLGVGPAFRDPCSLGPARLADALAGAGLVVATQRTISATLAGCETAADVADLLAHWVDASDNALIDPWRRADQATRDRWITRFGDGLVRRQGRLIAVLTVASDPGTA